MANSPRRGQPRRVPFLKQYQEHSMKLVDKSRPKSVTEIRGQAWIVDQLTLWLESPSSNAFVFSGGTGTGKTSAALALAADLGVAVGEGEFGGLYQISSGE